MTKVWLVWYGFWEDSYVEAVFTTKGKAEAYVAARIAECPSAGKMIWRTWVPAISLDGEVELDPAPPPSPPHDERS